MINIADLAKKIKRSIGAAKPVLVFIRATPMAGSMTVRCQPVQTPPEVIAAKFNGWCMLGCYDHSVPVEWLEDDLLFAAEQREIYVEQY